MKLSTVVAMLITITMAFSAQAQTKKTKKSHRAKQTKQAVQNTEPMAEEAAPAEPRRKKSLNEQYSGQGYGMAGCGLGSVVLGPTPGNKWGQVGVVITDTLVFPQTFAITSGISNCGTSGDMASINFIEANKVALESDIARGQGESLETLANLLGCDQKNLGSSLQRNYKNIFSSDNATQINGQILNTIKTQPSLAASCQIAG